MSNHEQRCVDPVTSHEDRRPINTDPREQPQWQGGQPPLMARSPQRGRSPWFWTGISVIILVVIFGGLAAASVLLSSTITETRNFVVGNQPTLVLTNGNGSVHISNGPPGQISVVARKHVFLGNTDEVPIHYDLSSDKKTLTITADDGSGVSLLSFDFNRGVDFDVTVPDQASLNVQTGNGSLSASGMSGQISMDTGNGNIDATNLSGPLTLKTGNGSITATHTTASGSSIFKTGNGDIDFQGTLDPYSSTLFTTGNGDIDLTLPNNAAFHLDASTGNGSIDSDFSYVTGDAANGTVGSGPPYAQVTLQTGNGSIHIHKSN